MEKFIEGIKSFNYTTYIGSNNSVHLPNTCYKFSDISVGDIILAKRYSNDIEKNILGFGHQVGPFIVIENKGDSLIAIAGTSCRSSLDRENLIPYFTIETGKVKKDTIFILNNAHTIDEEKFVEKVSRLSMEDLKHFQNKMNALNNPTELRKNLIVRYMGNLYFIRDINEVYISLIGLKKNGNKNLVTINGVTYEMLLNDTKFVFNYDQLKVVDIVQENIANAIVDKYTNAKDQKQKPTTTRGDLINYNSNLYYVYGTSGNMLNCFKVRTIANPSHRITIAGAPFDALFDETKDIDIRNLYNICLRANEQEIENIKQLKKDCARYKKYSKKAKSKENYNKKITSCTIVAEDKLTDDICYLVLRRNGNNLYTIRLDDLEEGKNYRIIDLNVHQVHYVGTYDEFEYYKYCTEINKFDSESVDQDLLSFIKSKKQV